MVVSVQIYTLFMRREKNGRISIDYDLVDYDLDK